MMSYCSGVRMARHSASVWVTGKRSCFIHDPRSEQPSYRGDRRSRHADLRRRTIRSYAGSGSDPRPAIAFEWGGGQNYGMAAKKIDRRLMAAAIAAVALYLGLAYALAPFSGAISNTSPGSPDSKRRR